MPESQVLSMVHWASEPRLRPTRLKSGLTLNRLFMPKKHMFKRTKVKDKESVTPSSGGQSSRSDSAGEDHDDYGFIDFYFGRKAGSSSSEVKLRRGYSMSKVGSVVGSSDPSTLYRRNYLWDEVHGYSRQSFSSYRDQRASCDVDRLVSRRGDTSPEHCSLRSYNSSVPTMPPSRVCYPPSHDRFRGMKSPLTGGELCRGNVRPKFPQPSRIMTLDRKFSYPTPHQDTSYQSPSGPVTGSTALNHYCGNRASVSGDSLTGDSSPSSSPLSDDGSMKKWRSLNLLDKKHPKQSPRSKDDILSPDTPPQRGLSESIKSYSVRQTNGSQVFYLLEDFLLPEAPKTVTPRAADSVVYRDRHALSTRDKHNRYSDCWEARDAFRDKLRRRQSEKIKPTFELLPNCRRTQTLPREVTRGKVQFPAVTSRPSKQTQGYVRESDTYLQPMTLNSNPPRAPFNQWPATLPQFSPGDDYRRGRTRSDPANGNKYYCYCHECHVIRKNCSSVIPGRYLRKPQRSSPGVLHHKEPVANKYQKPNQIPVVTNKGAHKLNNNVTGNSEKLPMLLNSKSLSSSRLNLNADYLSPDGLNNSAFPNLHAINNNESVACMEDDYRSSARRPKDNTSVGWPVDQFGRRLPLSPTEALRLYGDKLTEFERAEIKQYPEIWYLGLEARKIHAEENGPQNSGFDDENGSYNKVLHDHIVYRYEILEVIGKGSFGQVIRALDHQTDEYVAIKIIRNKKRFHHQGLVEVKILDHLRKRECEESHTIVYMMEFFYFRNHLCIVFELMSLNLYELIKKNNYQGFNVSLIRKFAEALVQCLQMLARENIIHCDLKPENVLLTQRGSSSIKVIDFGSSCYSNQRVYTYIQSRFYRSPEVILGLPYGTSIDMWSFGCILVELYTGFPLFPGENEVEQLACIMEVLGCPPPHVILSASRKRLFFDCKGNPRCVTNSKGRKRRPGSRSLGEAIKCNDQCFVDFLSRCFEWDPEKRMTPDEALRHEWLSQVPQESRPPNNTPPSDTLSNTKKFQPLSHDDLLNNADRNHFGLYKVYKGKKYGSRSLDGGLGDKDVNPSAKARSTNVSSMVNHTNRRLDQTDFGVDPSLDDSGTFLPPIL